MTDQPPMRSRAHPYAAHLVVLRKDLETTVPYTDVGARGARRVILGWGGAPLVLPTDLAADAKAAR